MKFDFETKAIFAKPCPYCGSKNVVTETRSSFYASKVKSCTYIECADCGAQVYGSPVRDEHGGYITSYNNAQHVALAAWNRRAG